MQPILNEGAYIFCTIPSDRVKIDQTKIIGSFKEKEGLTIILEIEIRRRVKFGLQFCRCVDNFNGTFIP